MRQPHLSRVLCVTAIGLTSFLSAHSVFGAPLVTGSAVRTFLGGFSGKMVYLKYGAQSGNTLDKNGRALWYLDFSEETLVEHKIIEYPDCEPRNPVISMDGASIVYNTWVNNNNSFNKSYVCPLATGASATLIATGAQPHWWVKPGTSEEYVYYVNGDIENYWKDQRWWPPCDYGSGNFQTGGCSAYQPSMIIRMVSRRPSGGASQMIPYYANGGRSRNGKYVFASSRATGTFIVDPLATANATVIDDIHFSTNIEGCNPSISPHTTDADIRFMWVNDPHDTIYIGTPQGAMTSTIHKNHDGTGSNVQHWDCPEWSTHANFAVASGYDQNNAATYDLYIIRLSDKQQLKVASGPANYPHLWVNDPSAAAVPAVSPVLNRGFSASLRNGVLDVSIGALRGAQLQVTDLGGRVVYRTALGNRSVSVRVAQPGIMVVRVVAADGTVLSKSYVNQE